MYTIGTKKKGDFEMKSDYRIRAEKFLHSIFPFIENYMTDPYMTEKNVEEYNSKKSRRVSCQWGSARIALVESDYVIKWDYDEECVTQIGGCLKEQEVYNKAVKDGFEYLLAATTLIKYNGYIFSIMPRINNIGYEHHKCDDIRYYLNDVECEWLADNGLLEDMHSYNWGILHNKACIIDYACVS